MNCLKSILLVAFLATLNSYSQLYRFNRYSVENGLAQDFVYSINQDANGYLWVGTGEGLSRFDGKRFKSYSSADGLSENMITTSFVDANGQIWFGHNEGTLSRFTEGKFKPIKNNKLTNSTVTGICGQGDTIYFVTQNDGLFSIINDQVNAIGSFGGSSFFDVAVLSPGNLLVATVEGVILLESDGDDWNKVKVDLEEEWFTDLSPSYDNSYLLASTNSGRLFRYRLNEGELQKSAWDDFKLGEINIKSVLQDQNLNIWLATYGQGLIKLHGDTTREAETEITHYDEVTGLSTNVIQSVFQDREGNIWIGTFGKGLLTLIDDYFTFYQHDPTRYGNSVSSIYVSEDEKFYGVENGLIRISKNVEGYWKFYTDSTGLVRDYVSALHMQDSTLWIGTKSNGLFRLDLWNEKIERINWPYGLLEKRVHDIESMGNLIWAATAGGLVKYNLETGSFTLYNTANGLPHNSIKTVIRDGKSLWIGTHNRQLYEYKNQELTPYEISTQGEIEVLDLDIDEHGNIWIATTRTGVYMYNRKGFVSYSDENGLKSNYCYSIKVGADQTVWVGHRGALSRIYPEEGEVEIYSHESGIEDEVNRRAMFLDSKGLLWIGTDGGAIKYDPSKDTKNAVAPVVNLISVIIDDKEYDINDDIVLPYGNYRVSFEYIGISFSQANDVTYQFKLEGYDGVFSDPELSGSATYGRLADGKYALKVIACNADGVCSDEELLINIKIQKPFWKTAWFIGLCILILALTVVLIVRLRLRQLKRQQVYLQTQLDIKTKEVVEKANEIAEINKDLTSSINYAERIQKSILPKDNELSDCLPNSFIFFRPRDIVSGDFYYLEKIENKLIVVCADCTGHGVPGAFMSMIGSVAIRNIYETMEITGEWKTPEKVLEDLDKEVEIVLKQKEDEELDPVESFFKSRDGMDLTICEVNLDTHEVLLSAAMRMSLIRQNGEIELISGDKRPIGGGESRGIDFSLRRYQMKKGDALFLFSDGYSDQFGGPTGRKLKLVGVRDIVQSLTDLNEEDYAHSVGSNFDLWKGDTEQIDDVLFMGLIF